MHCYGKPVVDGFETGQVQHLAHRPSAPVAPEHEHSTAWRELARLADITERLLAPAASPRAAQTHATELHAFFSRFLPAGRPLNDDMAMLPQGAALSPNEAAECILDAQRTRKFLAGVELGIRETLNRFPGRRINILYAGCGPFAPLLLPLLPRFSPRRVGVTLLDVQTQSLHTARHIAARLGLDAYIAGALRADGSDCHLPDPCHMLVCECMDAALGGEPQVAMMRNLVPQLAASAVVIPEQISVHAFLVDMQKEHDAARAGCEPAAILADRDICLPTQDIDGRTLMLRTRIHIHASHFLDPEKSRISRRTYLFAGPERRPGQTMRMFYRLGDRPGLDYTIMNDQEE